MYFLTKAAKYLEIPEEAFYQLKKTPVRRIPVTDTPAVAVAAAVAAAAAAVATHPWNPCQHRAMRLSRFRIPQLPEWAELAVFVCVSAPARLPVALWCQPAHCPPIRPEEHSPAATARRHPSDWGFLLDWVKCLLFPTLLEFNTSLFTGPRVAAVSLSLSLLPFSFYLSVFSLSTAHFFNRTVLNSIPDSVIKEYKTLNDSLKESCFFKKNLC